LALGSSLERWAERRSFSPCRLHPLLSLFTVSIPPQGRSVSCRHPVYRFFPPGNQDSYPVQRTVREARVSEASGECLLRFAPAGKAERRAGEGLKEGKSEETQQNDGSESLRGSHAASLHVAVQRRPLLRPTRLHTLTKLVRVFTASWKRSKRRREEKQWGNHRFVQG
jgi:hypothetical protein